MIAMCCQLPNTTMSATITSADANPSPSATHARSSNQLGATRNHYTTEVGPRIRTMEPLWSPVVATGGNPRQIGLPETAETSENRCRALRPVARDDGKEGVDGSSPSEDLHKIPANG